VDPEGWSQKELKMLRTARDRVIAEKLAGTVPAVKLKRNELGIPGLKKGPGMNAMV
jgi:hypothetical protein